jgi:hypothetical protein
MAMKEQQRQLHRSANGKIVDMNKLAMQNETTVAVGNIRVNARGDLLGPGGTIIKTHEEVVGETKQGVPDTVKVRKDVSNMDPEGNE